MPIIACKLPHGLKIEHDGAEITLLGANIGENLQLISPNGAPLDNSRRVNGYGLTEITEAQAETFRQWSDAMTYNNGQKADGKLFRPFPALDNGSILGPFKTIADAQRETASVGGIVVTGFEGVDPVAEAKKKGGVSKRTDD